MNVKFDTIASNEGLKYVNYKDIKKELSNYTHRDIGVLVYRYKRRFNELKTIGNNHNKYMLEEDAYKFINFVSNIKKRVYNKSSVKTDKIKTNDNNTFNINMSGLSTTAKLFLSVASRKTKQTAAQISTKIINEYASIKIESAIEESINI